ncbi:hypothetical protein ACLI1A_10250 [Flavobacterium sp. RHBU_3]|uniref:hypothetical protein n=1 Tax=Flavobacterium sp. RHBU_3 TaxID=3391184 RepID=UPI00398482A4
MSLYSRVTTFATICGIELAYSASVIPSVLEGYQPFVNNFIESGNFMPAHFGKASVDFGEESGISNAGISYKQKLTIQFPTSDSARATRLVQIQKVRFIKITLSNGKILIMGRNDYYQNARPTVTTKATQHLAQAVFETESILPLGYTPNPNASGLPDLIPIDLITDD